MEALKLLLPSDSVLYSLGVILFMVVMGIYLTIHVRKLMNAKPGKEGWDWPCDAHEASRFRQRTLAMSPTFATGGRVDPIVLKTEGMTCNHCVRAVKGALEAVPGVSNVEASLQHGTAEVMAAPNVAGLPNAVTSEGYVAAPLG